jgi:hypothetical protein
MTPLCGRNLGTIAGFYFWNGRGLDRESNDVFPNDEPETPALIFKDE